MLLGALLGVLLVAARHTIPNGRRQSMVALRRIG
jgi:hypothetical protein